MMTLEERAAFLKETELLSVVSHDVLMQVGAHMQVLEVSEGTMIFPEGAVGDANTVTVARSVKEAVADTGIGIPEDALERIFDEFQQVKGTAAQHKGTGLGLCITRQLVGLLGGVLSVESEEGKGSIFTVCLPMVLKPREPL